MADFGWEYPPGVTGNEPQISGVWPLDGVIDETTSELKQCQRDLEDAIASLEDQYSANKMGALPKSFEEKYDKVYDNLTELIDDVGTLIPEEPGLQRGLSKRASCYHAGIARFLTPVYDERRE